MAIGFAAVAMLFAGGWLASTGRVWLRTGVVSVSTGNQSIRTITAFQGRNGRVLVAGMGKVLMTDKANESLGLPPGAFWIAIGRICIGPSDESILTPSMKADEAMTWAALRHPLFRQGWMRARVPAQWVL